MRTETCTVVRLPPLGQSAPRPEVSDIMGRVLMSDDWIAPRFRAVLESLPPELRLLFRPITAVVISADIRPSFYWPATGAIYLDPGGLWLTEAERNSVPTTPDFRTSFGDALAFTMPWRYVNGSRYSYRPRPRTGAVRSFEDVRSRMARLLYHELAHANDYMSPERVPALPPFQLFQSAYRPDTQQELARAQPLRSSIMNGLARVSFFGDPASELQRSYGPPLISAQFSADGASDFYNYSNSAEDVAMLFEELMMEVSLGVDRDVAVTNRPTVAQPTGADYIVAWGQRNRVGDPLVRERARLVAHRILPEALSDAELDALPTPRQMQPGRTWTDNLAISASGRLEPLDAGARREADEAGIETGVECLTLRLLQGAATLRH